jgi:hypothetical protein
MTQRQILGEARGAIFDTVSQADQAIRRLRTAGFTEDELLVACPAKFKEECLCTTPSSETANVSAPEALAKGAVTGAALGGLALGAAVLTGGLSLPAAALLVGGSTFAGGFSNLIVTKGYEVEAPDFVRRAIDAGRIVVGVEVRDKNPAGRLAEAQRLLDEAGGKQLRPA